MGLLALPELSCDALQPQQFSCKPDLLLPFASRQSFIQLYSTPLFPPSDTSHHIPPQLHYFLASLYWAGEKGPRLERRTLHFVSLLQVQVYAAHNNPFIHKDPEHSWPQQLQWFLLWDCCLMMSEQQSFSSRRNPAGLLGHPGRLLAALQ